MPSSAGKGPPTSGGAELQIQPEDGREACQRLQRRVALARNFELPIGLLADSERGRGLLLGQPATLARGEDRERNPHIQLGNDAVEGAASPNATRRDIVAVLDGNKQPSRQRLTRIPEGLCERCSLREAARQLGELDEILAAPLLRDASI